MSCARLFSVESSWVSSVLEMDGRRNYGEDTFNQRRQSETYAKTQWVDMRLSAKICTSFIGRLGWTSYTFKQVGFNFFRSIHYVEEPSFTPNPSTFEGPKGVPEGSRIDLESYVQAANKETDFHFFSVSDYYHAYRNGTTTPSEVADWVIARVEESNSLKPGLCAVTQMDQESARKMARESSERVAKGCPCSVLDGIPILIKEELNCAPYHAKCGTSFMGKMPVIQDCTIAYKLKQAGAVIIGMTNMHELGMSVFGYNIDPDHGMPRNPYDPNHYTGGSSSGSAAAVASGLVPVAIGTDGGGSVRVPATLCGNVGLKPTFGRVSLGGNEVSCHSVVHAGPICSNVNDTALVYNVEVVRACEAAVDHLRNKGAEVVGFQIPELQELRDSAHHDHPTRDERKLR
ncbi:putative fatty acid amide hydrolase-like [Apostichopus japonicus]|uniref:Putative fatty acid amide hydrolase-like n=1 Tax=Stichopus japonicus TaxID=307972 RepID=A0A2G8KQM0_STIJA|nr:putative fatty acid amide hydrolase-like [Apostichopus japonicus]